MKSISTHVEEIPALHLSKEISWFAKKYIIKDIEGIEYEILSIIDFHAVKKIVWITSFHVVRIKSESDISNTENR